MSTWQSRFPAPLFVLLLGLVGTAGLAAAESWTLRNPTGNQHADEPVRVPLPIPDGPFQVLVDGEVVPHAVVVRGETRELWAAVNADRWARREVTIAPGAAGPAAEPLVAVQETDDGWEFGNGLVAVRLPKLAGGLTPPITALRWQDGPWIGKGAWHGEPELVAAESRLIADGTVFAAVEQRYRFADDRHATITVALLPGRRHLTITEDFAMGRWDAWSLDVAVGWDGERVRAVPYGMGFGQWRQFLERTEGVDSFPPTTLAYGQTRMQDTLLRLLPRWSQAYDDGWFLGLSDAQHTVGVLPARAGQWQWPHDCPVEVKVAESGEVCAVTAPTWRGARHWFLVAGPAEHWRREGKRDAAKDYAKRWAFLPLDKVANDFILSWPEPEDPADARPQRFRSRDIWNDGQINPTGMIRQQGRQAVGQAGRPGNYGHLTHAQFMLHPDTYGSYWLGWSPENPNFFSDLIKIPIAEITRLKDHPRFAELRQLAEDTLRTDIYHSVTLPGGAGQECPGYLWHAMHQWEKLAPICVEHLDFDPRAWPRFRAAAEFLVRLSYPDGGRRVCHPGGDTHPGKPDPAVFMQQRHGIDLDLKQLSTEELPGFGAVFRNRPGTGRETYLAFKAGPNRGHYHGDQLSFHWCTGARPAAVDHYASYNPRPGQEHMHNRVAFHTDDMPFANMDGYERMIAFKTAPQADCAIGQVESDRLRPVTPLPPELWDWHYPKQYFDTPLRYRRSIVQLKDVADTGDCFVIRDQYAGPELAATWCLHGYGADVRRDGRWFHYDAFSVYVAAPAEFAFERYDWSHRNGGGEQTRGMRVYAEPDSAVEFITVLVPRPVETESQWRMTLPGAAVKLSKRNKKPQVVDVQAVLSLGPDGEPTAAQVFIPALQKRPVPADLQPRDDGVFLAATVQGGRKHKGGRFTLELELDEAGPQRFRSSFADGAETVPAEGTAEAVLVADAAPLVPRTPAGWQPPVITELPDGVGIGERSVHFAGGIDDEEGTAYVSVKRGDELELLVGGADIDLGRSQGEIGLFVPDAGYPFGDIPDWLIEQRTRRPDWFRGVWPIASQAPAGSE